MRPARAPVSLLALVALLLAAALAPLHAAGLPAVVHRASVQVHAAPDLQSPAIANLQKNASVTVAGQHGLWYEVALPAGRGYVRVNELRMATAAGVAAGSNARALFTGRAGKGRVTETAGVRGLDESDLKAAAFDAAQLATLESYRVTPAAAAAAAAANGWHDTRVAWGGEAPAASARPRSGATRSQKRGGLALVRGLLSTAGVSTGAVGDSALDVAEAGAGKSEEEQVAEELALGPEIAGRVLGAAPLWQDAAAQRRVNLVGRWVASQTARPELPWVFGVIDSPEINAFAAPGGYVLVTRGMYALLEDDAQVAAVLGHEIGHVVQRDHYNVIRKQETSAALQGAAANQVGTSSVAGAFAKEYVRRHGATVLLTHLDRDAEFRADEAASIYLARAGFNPLALYAVLQDMAAHGTATGTLAQLYATHPPVEARLDRLDSRGNAGLERYLQRQ